MTTPLFGSPKKRPSISAELETPTCSIYTDGGAEYNGSPRCIAGWAFMIVEENLVHYGHGCKTQRGEPLSNNKAEISGALYALQEALRLGYRSATVYTDSQYLVNTMMQWRHTRKPGKAIKNDLLFKELCDLVDNKFGNVLFQWVKGHSTNEYNNLVDKFATLGVQNKTSEQTVSFGLKTLNVIKV